MEVKPRHLRLACARYERESACEVKLRLGFCISKWSYLRLSAGSAVLASPIRSSHHDAHSANNISTANNYKHVLPSQLAGLAGGSSFQMHHPSRTGSNHDGSLRCRYQKRFHMP
ncbi:hypothetical protein KC356_g105 [Hortaea werneckii]|nr:hypothetical protein KC356_g105 [Hortaea werneckii]